MADWKDKVPGGLADDTVPEDYDEDALERGALVEMERHGPSNRDCYGPLVGRS